MGKDQLIEKKELQKGRNLKVNIQESVWFIVGTQLLKGKVEKSRDTR